MHDVIVPYSMLLMYVGIISEIVACVFPVQIDVDSLAVAPKI